MESPPPAATVSISEKESLVSKPASYLPDLLLQRSLSQTPEIMAGRHVALTCRKGITWADLDKHGVLVVQGDMDVSRLPIGSVEFLRGAMAAMGVPEPMPLDYPQALAQYLHRDIRRGTLRQAAPDEWVKPVATKTFESGMAREVRKNQPHVEENTEVWICRAIQWRSEHRVYVRFGEILGFAQYDTGDLDDPLRTADLNRVVRIIEDWPDAPAAYALDVGIHPSGRLDLVEINDAWATGRYPPGIGGKEYIEWLATRWEEIAVDREKKGGF